MLSRIAEALFWVGRYVERAECTARILEVHVLRLLEDASADDAADGFDLLSVMGARPEEGAATDLVSVAEVLALDPASPVSVAASLGAAREAARTAREAVSSELWESLNSAWVELAARQDSGRRHVVGFCRWSRGRCATLTGLADMTLPRDEGWLLLQLGRCLERVDMTARLLALHGDESDPHVPVALLTACGAHDAYLRQSVARVSLEGAIDFLVLDPSFPRGLLWSLTESERCLADLSLSHPSSERDEAARALGRARTALEFSEADELRTALPRHLDALHAAVGSATRHLSRRYFSRGAPMAWVGGVQL